MRSFRPPPSSTRWPDEQPCRASCQQASDEAATVLAGGHSSHSPTDPRNLWLALAAAVAIQNSAVFQSSQSEHTTVFAVLVWGGAVICMEDQFEDLNPRPAAWGLILGTLLLLWVLARSAVIVHWDGLLFALAPIGGLALGLMAEKPARLGRFRDPLLCLMLLPGFALLMRVLPEAPSACSPLGCPASGSASWVSTWS